MVALAIALVPVLATAQASDDFLTPPYIVGNNIAGQNGGTGWAGPWGAASSPFGQYISVRNGGLTFPGLITAGNAAIADFGGAGLTIHNRFLATPYGASGTTKWLQFLVRPENLFGQYATAGIGGGVAAPGNIQVGLNSLGVGSRYLLIQHRPLSGPAVDYTVAYAFNPNQTYFVQARFDFKPGNLVDVTAWVWSTNLGPDVSLSVSNLYWAGTNTSFNLMSSGNYSYDLFYLGDQPDNPIPEAGTMVALGSFLSMGGLFLRRRFAKS